MQQLHNSQSQEVDATGRDQRTMGQAQQEESMAAEENKKLAVLIDADNAQSAVIKELLAEVSRYGTATIKRAYGDWTTTNLKGWKEVLHKLAIQPIQQFSYTTGKNSTDSSLIIDAINVLHNGSVDDPQAHCCVPRVDKSRCPASKPATDMSSFNASQCKPLLLSSTFALCSGAASSRRGNQASGSAIVRPSDKLTHKVSSSKRIDLGEMFIPHPFNKFSIRGNNALQFA
jgi:NYN domain